MPKTFTSEQRFELVDHQFGVMDRRSERTEFRTNQRFTQAENRLDRHDREFLDVKNSITDLAIMTKMEFDNVYEKFREVDKRFNEVDQRFDKVDKRFDELTTLIKQGFARTDKLEDQIKDLAKIVKRGFEKSDKFETQVKQRFEITDKFETQVKLKLGIT